MLGSLPLSFPVLSFYGITRLKTASIAINTTTVRSPNNNSPIANLARPDRISVVIAIRSTAGGGTGIPVAELVTLRVEKEQPSAIRFLGDPATPPAELIRASG